MAAHVCLLAGPARSGKTATLLKRYRQLLAARAIGTGLWLSPTRQAASQIRQRLLDGGLRGCFNPSVYTLEQFASAILAGSDRPPRFLGRLLKRQLIQRLLSEATARDELQYFAPIAHTTGLIDLVANFISDLKRQEIAPDRFAQLVEMLPAAEKNRELADLYGKYQRLLDEHELFDAEQRFRLASDWLNEQPPERWGPFTNIQLAIADGFTDFTVAQHRLLESLVSRAPHLDELIVTLPLEKENSRRELYDKPNQTKKQIENRHRGAKIEWMDRMSHADWPGWAHMERHLFANPREVPTAKDARRIEIVLAAGQRAEIEMLARRIKDLLILGDPAVHDFSDASSSEHRKVRPGDIAVVFRTLDGISPLVEEVFDEYGLPAAIDWQPRLSRAPILQALLAILRLQAADWPFRQLLAVLSNNYFQPAWREWHQPSARAATEWAVRQLQMPRGRRDLLSALEYRAKSDDQAGRSTADGDPLDDADSQHQQEHREKYVVAAAVLVQLAKALPSPEKPRTFSQWIGILDHLAHELGLLAPAAPSMSAEADQQAWQQLKDALAAESQLDEQLAGQPSLLLLSDFLARLQDILSVEPLPKEQDETGRIRVFSAQSVRALELPYLFLAGLSEKAFPLQGRDDRVFTEAEYRRLNEVGDVHFPSQQDHSCEEMLLFYEVVTRATRQLVLSYPALDEAAQPLSPSPYLIELERCLGIQPRSEISLSPVPQHAYPYSPTEGRIKAVAELIEGKPDRFSQLIARHATNAENVAASLRAAVARDQHEFSPYEGIILGGAAKQQLAKTYGSEHCWSVSRLEEYAYCPFRFFGRNVLALEELPELSLETNYGRRGLLAHEALAELHRRLNAAGAFHLPSETTVEEFARYRSETITLLQEQLVHGDPLEVALRTIDITHIGQWLAEYLAQHQSYETNDNELDKSVRPEIRPAHFEVSFGLKRRSGEKVDLLSTDKPFDLVCGDQTIRFSGRIDRIDIGLVGGQVVFNVLDYKTGSNKKLKRADFEHGLALQLPLYAMAVQELLLIDRRALPWRVGYWYLKDKGFESHDLPQLFQATANGVLETSDWHALRGTLLSRVVEMVQGIRGGAFPVFSVDKDCTSRCEFHTVCRIGQIRALGKTWNGRAPANGKLISEANRR